MTDVSQQIESGAINLPEVFSIAGARAGIRRIFEKGLQDALRMFQIEQSGGMRYIAEEIDRERNLKKIREWIKSMNRMMDKERLVEFYAVTATKLADPGNHGEVEGWIRADSTEEERERYARVSGNPLNQDDLNPFEIAFIKRPGGVPNLMSEAILTLCYRIACNDAEINKGYEESEDYLK